MEVRDAGSEAELAEARRLFRAFLAWQQARPDQAADRVAAYFDPVAWAAEVDGLPGEYAPGQGGALLLGWVEGTAHGCVGLRRLDEGRCEVKRMYVDAPARGTGLGRALGEAVVARARALGYAEALLDTSTGQREAIGLYRSLGFEPTEPYHDVPEPLRGWLVFFSLAL